jgi:hypothetical protein
MKPRELSQQTLTRFRVLLTIFRASPHARRSATPTGTDDRRPTPEPQTQAEIVLTGGKGHAAPELKREDVRVYVDGVERPVVSFEKEVLPASYGLVVDNSGSLRSQSHGGRRPRRNSARRQNGPGDETFVVGSSRPTSSKSCRR